MPSGLGGAATSLSCTGRSALRVARGRWDGAVPVRGVKRGHGRADGWSARRYAGLPESAV